MALALTDFNSDLVEDIDMLSLITSGMLSNGTFYASPPRGDVGTLHAGSDINFGTLDEPITRMQKASQAGQIRFNDDGPESWTDYLTVEGAEQFIYIQTEADGVESFLMSDNIASSGGGFVRLTMTAAFEAILTPVLAGGVEFIIAFGVPVSLSLPGVPTIRVELDTAFSTVLGAATGGTPPYTYTLTGLPSGFTFDATTRELAGMSSVKVNAAITYSVTDSLNFTSRSLSRILVGIDEPTGSLVTHFQGLGLSLGF